MENEITFIEKLWDTNSLTVYGILVVLLVIFNVFQWRRNQSLTDLIMEQHKEIVPTYAAVLARLEKVTEDIPEVKNKVLEKLLR